jgi:excisionase family DNA binding protein
VRAALTLTDQPTAAPQLMTIKQIAGACQLSEKAVRRAIDAGELTAVKLRSRLRVTPQDFDAWIRSSSRSSDRGQFAPPCRARRLAPTGTFRALIQSERQTGAAS